MAIQRLSEEERAEQAFLGFATGDPDMVAQAAHEEEEDDDDEEIFAGAAGGDFGGIGLSPLGLGPLKCPFSQGFVSCRFSHFQKP